VARMIPETFPEYAGSSAERRVYDALAAIPAPYTVLYDISWLGRGVHEGTQGQCDFLVLHPTRGPLVVEVKGGTPRRDAGGQWWSSGTEGDFAIEDPFAQANRSKFALRSYLRACSCKSAADALWGHAVWFPDASAPKDCGPEGHPAITLDYAANASPAAALERAFDYWAGNRPRPAVGKGALEQIVFALGRPMELKAPLAVTFQQEAVEQRRLTEEQYRLLSTIDRQRRVVISGPAGSGKTMLAVEQCRRFAAAGLETAYICFNRRLADWVKAQLSGLAPVTADTFHGLVDRVAEGAGVELPSREQRDSDFFENRAPEILIEIAAEAGPRFDAIVIDEAQDFHDWWLTAFESLLREAGREIIFLDSNQQIFSRQSRPSLLDESLRLTVNCRTTKAIHHELQRYSSGDTTDCTGPEGRPPKHVSVSSDRNEAREVQRELYHLTQVEGVELNRIVILTPRRETSHWEEGQKLGNFSLTWTDRRDEKTQVLCATIHAFKGMESDVVLLTEMAKVHEKQRSQMWYTALSRARHQVVIFEMSQPERTAQAES
jgi:Nuclease-related domain/AAA domain/UvrD-like helicase C-terminal domain